MKAKASHSGVLGRQGTNGTDPSGVGSYAIPILC